MNSPASNEDKLAWCEKGEKQEQSFVLRSLNSGLSVIKNPAKNLDKYTHDLYAIFQSDLKSISTPFNTAGRYGIDSKYAITINEKDVVRYKNLYPNIMLILDINYPSYKGVRIASINRISWLIEHDRAKKHTYKDRVDDTNGNAKDSYVFDLRWFDEVTL
jgi:hypothetical protein